MSSLRKQGPITTSVDGCARLLLQHFPKTQFGGYGSRLSARYARLAGTTSLNLHHLPWLERGKFLARNIRFIERRAQCDQRRVDGFVGQLKRAVVMRQRLHSAAIGQRF